MLESRDWAAGFIFPVIRQETGSPFQVVPLHKSKGGSIGASFEVSYLFPRRATWKSVRLRARIRCRPNSFWDSSRSFLVSASCF